MNELDLEFVFKEWEPILVSKIEDLSLSEKDYSETTIQLTSSFGIQFCYCEYSQENMKFITDSNGNHSYTGSPTIHLKEISLLDPVTFNKMDSAYSEHNNKFQQESISTDDDFIRAIFDWFILVWNKTIQYDYIASSFRNSSDYNKPGKGPIPGINCTALQIEFMCIEKGWYYDLINKIEY